MDRRIPIYFLIAGLGSHQAHDGTEEIEREPLDAPAIEARLFGLMPHGGEPEPPGWPLRAQEVAVASTASASTAFAISPLVWPSS